jgi:hypothetical protein
VSDLLLSPIVTARRRAPRFIFRNSKFFVRDERGLGINDRTPAFGIGIFDLGLIVGDLQF